MPLPASIRMPHTAYEAMESFEVLNRSAFQGVLRGSVDPWVRANATNPKGVVVLGVFAAPMDAQYHWPVVLCTVTPPRGRARTVMVSQIPTDDPRELARAGWNVRSFTRLRIRWDLYAGDRAGLAGIVNGDDPAGTPVSSPAVARVRKTRSTRRPTGKPSGRD
jgi:hypothetical protein